jgi:hypothetical protein
MLRSKLAAKPHLPFAPFNPQRHLLPPYEGQWKGHNLSYWNTRSWTY